jgi:hypothetical protein
MNRFFLVFDAIVVVVIAVQVWSLARVLRRRPELPSGWPRWSAACLPFAWEAGLALFVLLALPSSMGMTWQQSFASIPDLTLVLASVTTLWLLTGLARARLLAVAYLARRGGRLTRGAGASRLAVE